jgi:RNA polymerase sigma factor (sigma-70 family)
VDKKTFSIALKTRAKHGIIFNYMLENNLTFEEFRKQIGISKSTLEKMVNFKWVPTKNNPIVVEKLTKFFDCTIEKLFPKEIVDLIEADSEIAKMLQSDQIITKEVELVYLNFEEMLQLESSPYDQEIEDEVFKKELQTDVEKVLKSLTSREETVVKMYFGIGDNDEHTLEEIGKKLKIVKETARHTLVKAMRKIRHPSRLNLLKQYN